MNNKQSLIRIAKLIVDKGEIDKKTADSLLNNLSRKNLKIFARLVKDFEGKNSINVVSGSALSNAFKQKIKSMFPSRKVVFEIDETTGEGIKLITNNTVIDLTLNGFVENTIEELKN